MTRQAGAAQGVLLLLAAVLPMMGVVLLVPIVPLLGQQFAATPGVEILVPLALTLPALCMALVCPLVGVVADRFGRKQVLIAALVLYALVGALPALLSDLISIIIARAVLGCAEAAIITMSTTLLGDYFKGPRLQRWVALQVGGVSISAIIVTALGGILGEALGVQGPFLAYLLAIPLALVSAWVLFEPLTKSDHGRGLAFPIGRFIGLLATTLGAGLLFYTLFLQVGPVLVAVGVTSPALIGLAAALANVGNASGAVLFRLVGPRWPHLLLGIGFALSAVGYASATIATGFVTVTIAAVVAALGAGTLLPALITRMLDGLPMELRGRGTGMWNSSFFLAQFLSPILAVVLASAMGGLIPVIALFAVLGGLAAIAAFAVGANAPTAVAH